MTASELPELVRKWKRESYLASKEEAPDTVEDEEPVDEIADWRSGLILELLAMTPSKDSSDSPSASFVRPVLGT